MNLILKMELTLNFEIDLKGVFGKNENKME